MEINCPAKTCKYRASLGNCVASKVKFEFCDDSDNFNCVTYVREEE